MYALLGDDGETSSTLAGLSMLREAVEDILTSLTAREAAILRFRYGLAGKRPHTLEEVGQKLGITRERVRQIEGAALRKLRHPRRARKLKGFVEFA